MNIATSSILRRAALGAAITVGLGSAGSAFAQQSGQGQNNSAEQHGQPQGQSSKAKSQSGQWGKSDQASSQQGQDQIKQAIQEGQKINLSAGQIAQVVVLFPADQQRHAQAMQTASAGGQSSGQHKFTRTDDQSGSKTQSASNDRSAGDAQLASSPQAGESGGSARAGSSKNAMGTVSLIFLAEDKNSSHGQSSDTQKQTDQKQSDQKQASSGQMQLDPNAFVILTADDAAAGSTSFALTPNQQGQTLHIAAMHNGKPAKITSATKQGDLCVLTVDSQSGQAQSGEAQGGQAQSGQGNNSADAVVLIYLSQTGSQQSGSGTSSH